jgi:uncharacterized protein (DUF1810 family)
VTRIAVSLRRVGPTHYGTLHPDERIYTFWDYFRNAFGRNAGFRIDHLLLSPSIAGRLVAADADREVRGRERASDHAPTWIELADPRSASPRRAPFDLKRFVTAHAPVFETALDELRAGRKQSHWMWFVYPQLRGLGHSSTARFYAISSLDEARTYLAHPLLGPRLILCARTVAEIEGSSLHTIFGSPDDMKFRSCMTRFSLAADHPDNPFHRALDRCCDGRPDERTLALIGPGR